MKNMKKYQKPETLEMILQSVACILSGSQLTQNPEDGGKTPDNELQAPQRRYF